MISLFIAKHEGPVSRKYVTLSKTLPPGSSSSGFYHMPFMVSSCALELFFTVLSGALYVSYSESFSAHLTHTHWELVTPKSLFSAQTSFLNCRPHIQWPGLLNISSQTHHRPQAYHALTKHHLPPFPSWGLFQCLLLREWNHCPGSGLHCWL